MVELVDTKDLKSLPLAECRFESGRGHHNVKMVKQITVSEFKKLSFKKSDYLVDVRSPEEWKAFGKPDGEAFGLLTHFIPYQFKENENIILNSNFIDEMNALKLNKNNKIFFICRSGIRSQIVAEIYKKKQFQTFNIKDGSDSWLLENLPVKQFNY